ncbi:uncharacterized mitochondrial protein AtMg00810-like [Setaria viridis]|uniref:uncharacterized mitochondrial protein AtMg00810-like n=1 Tax=Setaria viridis TaxID=4556 RepID=UPI003B3B1713
MQTRSKLGHFFLALLHIATLSLVPTSFQSALADPYWRSAMQEEHDALLRNHTWDLVPRPPGANVVIDLRTLHHFLGVHVRRTARGLFLSQHQYTLDILKRANMSDCKTCATLVDTCAKLSAIASPPVKDATAYRSLASALQYLTFTRPNITYAIQQICLYMHDPQECHLVALKRILRYLRGTATLGLQIWLSSSSELVVYSDADWAGCLDTRYSTSGYAVFLGDNLVSWSSKRQHTISC